MIFFFDNNTPPRFSAALRAFDHDVRHITECVEHFPRKGATPDEEWIPIIGRLGWIAVTSDRRILAREQQRRLLIEAKLITFFMPSGFVNLPLWPQFELLVKAWPNIVSAAERARSGDLYEVQQNGKVTYFTPRR